VPGPAKQPRHLKLVKGTLQKCRDTGASASLPAFDKLPPPPRWMMKNAHAVREWRRLGPFLIANGLLGEGSISAFGLMCALYGRNVDLFSRGITPTAAHIATYRALCGSLGLLAMNLSQPKDTNPFSKHRRPS
jgi:phage terminase small subunit